ncbi:hypothetical protein TNIN_354421 [Trichonephila inaurata madagascariensis]|uniref:Uncharacterized protein n=1 Tax=Trichonephila inaurata madagascariensis TaxID=2747483 RepID=A0A8X6YTU9_9ARAC|nr:hypothetical protein TNIN_354421 [Trichonephila inaurata madagascariensis]
MNNYDFFMSLVESIVEKYHVAKYHRNIKQKLQGDNLLCDLHNRHFPDIVPIASLKKNASKKCVICTKNKVQHKTHYLSTEWDV